MSDLELVEVVDGARQDCGLTLDHRHVDDRNVERRVNSYHWSHHHTALLQHVGQQVATVAVALARTAAAWRPRRVLSDASSGREDWTSPLPRGVCGVHVITKVHLSLGNLGYFGPYIKHSSLVPHECTCQTASRSVHPFCRDRSHAEESDHARRL